MATISVAQFYQPTSSNANFLRSKFISAVDVINNFQPENHVDLLNPKLIQLINSLTVFSTYQFKRADKLVNISYKYYRTTSLWWLILLASGQIHPYEIPEGSVLLLPSLTEMADAINRLNPVNQTSKTVVI